jgi:hypothetical protein
MAGTGVVTYGKDQSHPAEYAITASIERGIKKFSGVISAKPAVLMAIFERNTAVLTLEDGSLLEIMISSVQPFALQAQIAVTRRISNDA